MKQNADNCNNTKKNGQDKSNKGIFFISRKNKANAALLALFLLVGSGVFLFMIRSGTKDLLKTESDFSYNNVIRDAFTPVFDILGFAPDRTEKANMIAKGRVNARGFEFQDAPVDISDWLGTVDGSSGSSGGPGYSKTSKTNDNKYNQNKTPYRKMNVDMGSGLSFGGGSSQTSSDANSVKNSKIKDSSGESSDKDKSSKQNTLNALNNTRESLKTSLRSDSAATAKTNWGASFEGGKTVSFSNGSAVGNNKALGAYDDKGLVKLDKIKSGEIASLKKDPKTSIPQVGVPKPVAADRVSSLFLDALSDGLKDGVDNIFGSDEEKKSKKKQKNDTAANYEEKDDKQSLDNEESSNEELSSEEPEVMSMMSTGNSGNSGSNSEPASELKSLMENTRCSADHSERLDDNSAITYEDTKVTYKDNGDGTWDVTYVGKYTMIDTNTGESTENGTYEDTFTLNPKANPPVDLYRIQQNGQVLIDMKNPVPGQLPEVVITPQSGGGGK